MSEERGAGQHPTAEELAAWMWNKVPPPAAAALFAHLRGCDPCRQRWARQAVVALTGPDGAPEPPLGPDTYDLALRRAFSRADLLTRPRSLDDPSTRWGFAAYLLDCAADKRNAGQLAEAHDDAYLAVVGAMSVPNEFGRPQALADLRCHAWMELGNLRRALNDLEGAEEAFCESQDWFEAGSQHPPLLARWLDLAGSLFRDQLRFDEAAEALEDAATIHLEYGCGELAASTLINLGFTYQAWGKPNLAVNTFHRAFKHLLPYALDAPLLTLKGMHNALLAMVDAGAAAYVATRLWKMRRLYEVYGTPHLRIQFGYLEAKVMAQQGHDVRAEKLFKQTIDAFRKARLPYDAAVAALDLAAFLVERGRPAADVLAVLDGAVKAFVRRQIFRELLISFRLLRDSVAAGQTQAESFARFADTIRAAAARPGART